MRKIARSKNVMFHELCLQFARAQATSECIMAVRCAQGAYDKNKIDFNDVLRLGLGFNAKIKRSGLRFNAAENEFEVMKALIKHLRRQTVTANNANKPTLRLI